VGLLIFLFFSGLHTLAFFALCSSLVLNYQRRQAQGAAWGSRTTRAAVSSNYLLHSLKDGERQQIAENNQEEKKKRNMFSLVDREGEFFLDENREGEMEFLFCMVLVARTLMQVLMKGVQKRRI